MHDPNDIPAEEYSHLFLCLAARADLDSDPQSQRHADVSVRGIVERYPKLAGFVELYRTNPRQAERIYLVKLKEWLGDGDGERPSEGTEY
jgi:hypothetical protein